MNTRRRSDSRSAKPAMIQTRSSAAHHLEVGVLERRAHDADLVDVLARLDQLAHDPRDVLARGLREVRARRARSRPRRRPRCESSAGVPAATTSPRAIIATRSQTSSTSDSRCEFSSTATPRSRSVSSSSRTVRRPAGSSALVGSSSSSSLGSPIIACAIPSRCCMPFDIAPTRRVAHLGQADQLQQLRALGRARRASPRASGAAPAPRPRSASPGTGTARRGSRASPLSRDASRSSAAPARRRSSRASTCRRRSGRAARPARLRRRSGRRP